MRYIIFDIHHGITRIVEKLVRLEIEKLLSQGNKHEQVTGVNSSKDLVSNLENNINKRKIRQGNFQIRFDRTGKREPITLNKDHAVCLLSPPPSGQEDEYPHVLSNVVSSTPLPDSSQDALTDYFDITPISTFDVVKKIWDCVYEMFTILRMEPEPLLREGKPQGSLRPDDYSWGYSPDTKAEYKKHAGCFYKLKCTHYTCANITPYMIKFIDYARYFMDKLNSLLCRFQSEGGEHLNYCHSSIFKHTETDPQFSYLLAMFQIFCYEISSSESRHEFDQFMSKHVAACKIQAAYRVQQKFSCQGPYLICEGEIWHSCCPR